MTTETTRSAWLHRHPYLQPVATLHAIVDAAADEVPIPVARVPRWEDYLNEFHAGVPLLHSSRVPIDLSPAAPSLAALVERLTRGRLPGALTDEPGVLHAELRATPDAARRAVAWLLDAESFAPTFPGLLQYLGWSVVTRSLGEVVHAFDRWRDEERWFRSYCPTCGAAPAMAQLVGADPGRLRLLCCGRCRTRWRYRRTGCPFCQTADDHRLAALAVEGEGALRLDYCESCRGYLKTYVGEGDECLLLADWTSLHLDVVAGQQQLNRVAASLYQV